METDVARVKWTGEGDGIKFFLSEVIFEGVGVTGCVIGDGGMIFLNDVVKFFF